MKAAANDNYDKLINENVNVTRHGGGLLTLIKVTGIFLIGFIVLCFVFNFACYHIVSNLSPESRYKFEDTVAKLVSINDIDQKTKDEKYHQFFADADKIARKLSELDKGLQLNRIHFHITKDIANPNAVSLSNGDIYVTASMLDTIGDDTAMLAFVLCHEMGHYRHQDYLGNIGTRLALALASMIGVDVKVTSSVGSFAVLNFSRDMEYAADEYAVKFLDAAFHSRKGATDFFEKDILIQMPGIFYYLSDHPSDKDRLDRIKKLPKNQKF